MKEYEKDIENEKYASKTDILFDNEKKEAEKLEKHKKRKAHWVTRSIAEELGREELLRRTVIESLIYFGFLVFATIYILGLNSISFFYLTKGIKQQFLDREFSTLNDSSITFSDIKSAADFWQYVQNHMVHSFFWESTHGIGKETEQNSMNILYENQILGVPRMRQLRVRNDSCIVHEYFRKYFVTCYSAYSTKSEERKSYGPGKGTAWVYSSAAATESLPYSGKISSYSGGGFYLDLPDTKEEFFSIIEDLKENLWITRNTRAIFVDFSVYNANLNIFGIGKLIFEFPTTGGIIPSMEFHSLKLIRVHTTWDWFILFCEVMCLFFVLFYTMEEIREIMYFRHRYFLRFWNYVDLSIILLIICGLIFSSIVMMQVPPALSQIKLYPRKYGNLEYVASMLYMRDQILAVALFLMYLKLFKFLNFNRTMGQLNNTLGRCAYDIMGFSVMFFIIFFAYAILGYLLFGNQVASFSTFGVAMFTLLRTILGDFNYEEIEEANRVLAPLYFHTYIFLVFFVLLNMFLAIINDTYTDVKTEIALAPNELQMSEYIQNELRKLLRKLGLDRFVPQKTESKNGINATSREIREVLKKCGFTDLEIEMFFARYNIDPYAKIKDNEQLLNELNDILKTEDDKSIQAEDFLRQQEKLQQIEITIGRLVEQVKTLIEKMERMDSVYKEKKEIK